MRLLLSALFCLLACLSPLAGCARNSGAPEAIVTGQMDTAGPFGLQSYSQTDVFGLPLAPQATLVNPSPSRTIQINLYDPQSFWDGAFDQNWMDYGW